jgi:integrase
MARPARGQIVVNRGVRGTTYAARFRTNGKRYYETLTASTIAEAEQQLEDILSDVRRGRWQPATPAPVVAEALAEPTFHVYASEWLARRQQEGLKAKTVVDLRWSLELHLLPFFAGHPLSTITAREVKRYVDAKLAERSAIEAARAGAAKKGEPFRERSLDNGSINHTIRHLSQILDDAVFPDELIATNPAANRKLRLSVGKPARPWVEPEQLMTFLDAAPNTTGRLLLSILAGAGLRIGEALDLRWRDVDLGTGTLHIRDSKTAKGVREVHLSPALRELLTLGRADRNPGSDRYVVATSTGRRHNPSNLRRDVLAKTVTVANDRLEATGIAPIGCMTFHGLRRTYASLRCVCGDDMRYTADQLGHEDVRFTMRCYAQAAKRRDRMAKPQRDSFDRALQWAEMGRNDALTVPVAEEATV